MSCGFSREWLALHAEGDLCGAPRELAEIHVQRCAECAEFLDDLRLRQQLLKSLRQETATRAECTAMRSEVMNAIHDRRLGPGAWLLGLERMMWLGLRRQAYALAAAALLVVSVSVVAQNRATPAAADADPIFAGQDSLIRPERYRDWVMMPAGTKRAGESVGHGAGAAYVNPRAYRERERGGQFPDGTVMVWESAHGPLLLAAVKDSARFADGWGFFDFSGGSGSRVAKAEPLPDASGCRTCHLKDAGTDHTLAQF